MTTSPLRTARDSEIAEEGCSLKFASAKVSKVGRLRPAESGTAGSQGAGADPRASDGPGGYTDKPPF